LSGIVVDASVALAWCFPEEASEYADTVLVALEGHPVLVPAVWALEIMNAVVVAERRRRVSQPEVRRFVELLDGLTINELSLPVGWNSLKATHRRQIGCTMPGVFAVKKEIRGKWFSAAPWAALSPNS